MSLAAALAILAGTLLMLLASVGITRMPDIFTRMHASTKASSLGAAFLLTGVALYHASLSVSLRAGAIIVFFFLTMPVAAHLLGRAAYHLGVPLWERTVADELRDHLRLEHAQRHPDEHPPADPPPR